MRKNLKRVGIYAILMISALVLIGAILSWGDTFAGTTVKSLSTVPEASPLALVSLELFRNLKIPFVGLLMQILVILGFSRICGVVARVCGQPQVVGEMIAGIILGKSALALISPDFYNYIFPDVSMPRLYMLSQIGLILFMFVVGLELDLDNLKKKAGSALLVSHVSIVFPFLLGTLVALAIYPTYSQPGVSFSSFALFMGIAMSITAFPVLARMIQELGITQTPLGIMALTCAAIDDVSAWCLLAAVLGIVRAGSPAAALAVLALTFVYVVVMAKLVRPVLNRVLHFNDAAVEFTRGRFAIVVMTLLASALCAEVIGIHALFGAFLAGLVIPKKPAFRASLIERIEDLSGVVLLPLFFAFTGIRTQIGLLNDLPAWGVCACIILVGILGKMVASALAARWAGEKWREAWALGALMNTRGLMELVVLNIGYDLGILSPTVFTMMVMMALITTLMTCPLFKFFISFPPKTFAAQAVPRPS